MKSKKKLTALLLAVVMVLAMSVSIRHGRSRSLICPLPPAPITPDYHGFFC